MVSTYLLLLILLCLTTTMCFLAVFIILFQVPQNIQLKNATLPLTTLTSQIATYNNNFLPSSGEDLVKQYLMQ